MTSQFLIVDVVNLALKIIGTFLSSLLLYILRRTGLMKQKSLLLIHCLIIFDFLNFTLGLINSIYLIWYWNEKMLNYDPLVFFLTSLPMLIHDKGLIVILIGIAFDRILAVRFPAIYRFLRHTSKAVLVSTTAICAGAFDIGVYLATSGLMEHPNCGAFGCFMTPANKKIMGISTAVLGIILLICTLVFICKLFLLSNNRIFATQQSDKKLFSRANRMALISLTYAGLLVIIPSGFIAVYDELANWIFKLFGPVLSSCFLVAGILNSVVLLLRNTEINDGLKSILRNTTVHELQPTQRESKFNENGYTSSSI